MKFFRKRLSQADRELEAECAHLSELFHEALKFFCNTTMKHDDRTYKLIELPWFIIIGPAADGKSSLLRKSQLEFIHAQKFSHPTTHTTNLNCDFWITKDAIYLDIAGKYFDPTENDTTQQQRQQAIIRVLKKYQRKKPLHGIILAVSVQHFMPLDPLQVKKDDVTYFAKQSMQFARALARKEKIPLTVMLTKCDLISGFKEYFNHLSKEEQHLTFGIRFEEDVLHSTESCMAYFNEAYYHILKNIHLHTIKKIHHANTAQERTYIQHFPLEFEQLFSQFGALIEAIYHNSTTTPRLYLADIYFTSSMQQGPAFDSFARYFKHRLSILNKDLALEHHDGHPFFIQQALQKLTLRQAIPQNSYQTYPWLRQATLISSYGLLAVTSTCMAYQWMQNLNEDVQNVHAAEMALAQYTTLLQELGDNNVAPLEQVILPLNALTTVKQKLSHIRRHAWLDFFYENNSHQLADKSKTIYHHALQTLLLPQLRELIATHLNSNQITLPSQLYATLKTYLMLGNPKYLESPWIEDWLNDYWMSSHPRTPETLPELKLHLKNALASQNTKIALNSELIAKTRAKLYALPIPQLSYALLLSESNNKSFAALPLLGTPQASTLFTSNPQIPYLYTRAGFENIFSKQLTRATQAAIHGNWVLGRPPSSTSDGVIVDEELRQQTRALYLSDYVEVWDTALQQLHINHFVLLQQLSKVIDQLVKPENVMTMLIANLKDNTEFLQNEEISQPHLAAKIGFANQKFMSLIRLVESEGPKQHSAAALKNKQQDFSHWHSVSKNLNALKNILHLITHAKNPNFAAFELSKYRLNHPDEIDIFNQLAMNAQQLPAPVGPWLGQLTRLSWQLILNQAQNHLQNIWLNEVYPIYQSELINRYPLVKDSYVDANWAQFSAFFAPSGLLDQFFRTHLAYFIDMQTQPWSLRTRDGFSLNLSNETLAQFQQIYLFREQFFPNARPTIAIPIKLIPLAFTPDITQFNLQIDQTHYPRINEKQTELAFVWGTKGTLQLIHYDIYSVNDDPVSATFRGPWALLKLIDHNYLEQRQDKKHFELVVDLNGHGGKYELITDTDQNPFLTEKRIDVYLPKNLWNPVTHSS